MIFRTKSCGDYNHRFQPRYNTIPPNADIEVKGSSYACIEYIKALTKSVYVHDVCVKCGKTTAQAAEPEEN